MTIFDYVKKYNYTFEEAPFNEVDNVIFSTLAYVDFNGILKNKMTIKDLANDYFLMHPKIKKGEIIAVKVGIKLLKEVMNSKRFKNIYAYNYHYESDEKSQYGAITFDLGDTLYIAYEGTDALISGWEEDFAMVYKFPVSAHKKATKYLNKYLFTNKKLIIGGHSKGGNLALVSSMMTNFIIRSKIINIYSNDGQGLRLKEINSRRYKKISNKYIHLIPHNSIVGLLLRHENDYIIKSNAMTLFSHATSTWKIDKNKFIKSELNNSSKTFDKAMIKWLTQYDDMKRREIVKNIFDVMRVNNITSLVQIKSNPKEIIKIMKSSNIITDSTREMLNDLITIINKVSKETV